LGFVPQPNLHGLKFLGKTYAVLGDGGEEEVGRIINNLCPMPYAPCPMPNN
jgi:hypothetical protein